MLGSAKDNLKTLVLIKLTKSLIENSDAYAMFKLEKMFSEKKQEEQQQEKQEESFEEKREKIKEKIKEKVKEKLNYTPSIMKRPDPNMPFFTPTKKKDQQQKGQIKKNKHKPHPQPKPRPKPIKRRTPPVNIQFNDDLPEHLRYLRPTKTATPQALELGKVAQFLNDKNVKSVEIAGPDQVIYVNGTMGRQPTAVSMTKEEIDAILDTFSKVGKVPKTEGLFKVATSNLILTAIVSESIGSRFVIKKM